MRKSRWFLLCKSQIMIRNFTNCPQFRAFIFLIVEGNVNQIIYRFNIPAEEGESILAVTGGTVIETNPENVPGQGEGIYITIQAPDGRKWRYSHLSDYYVSEGDTVKAGDRIAAVGATGWCTGPLVCISFPDSEVIDPANDTNNTAG